MKQRPKIGLLPLLLATWFGSGLLPGAPGTWGSLAALPFAYALTYFFGPWVLLAAALVLFPVGWWASEVYVGGSGVNDPGAVVIDEVVAQWLVLLPALPGVWWHWVAGFVLFRVFDVLKPWPVGWVDARIKGGFGVMADDILAAIYAGPILYVMILIF